MEKFTKLGLGKELTDVLKKLNFEKPSEIQEKAIPLVLAGKDIIGGSATGSGKTLAFASGIIEKLKPNKSVQALILTPTRELADQVANSIKEFGQNKNLKVLPVYGGIRIDSQIRRMHTTDVVVGTPGRVIDHIQRKSLKLKQLKFLVLDEVDRMFDMGFSKDVERILRECPDYRQTMMFSATISPDIDYLAKKYTKDATEISVKSYIDASKLKQIYYDVPDKKKFSLLVSLLKKENADLVMVFCSTRRNVDFITDNLRRTGIHAKAIHGGIEQKKRTRVLSEFHEKGVGVLVCTDVAARGLDIKGVSHVYNYDVPGDTKDYIHRIGRTARAGNDGKAITILASRDYEKFGDLMQLKDTKIIPEELPPIEMVRVQRDQGKNDSRDRGNSRSDGRSSKFGRSDSRGGSSRFGRSDSRGGSSRPRGDSRSGPGRNDSRSDGRSSRFGRSDSRSGSNRGPSRSGRSDSKPRRSFRDEDSDRKPSDPKKTPYNRKKRTPKHPSRRKIRRQ